MMFLFESAVPCYEDDEVVVLLPWPVVAFPFLDRCRADFEAVWRREEDSHEAWEIEWDEWSAAFWDVPSWWGDSD